MALAAELKKNPNERDIPSKTPIVDIVANPFSPIDLDTQIDPMIPFNEPVNCANIGPLERYRIVASGFLPPNL